MEINKLVQLVIEQAYGMWRFRWAGLVAVWCVAALGWVVILLMPNIYNSHGQVYVDVETTLKPLFEGLAVSTNTLSQAGAVTQALTSRAQLEAVVEGTGLSQRVRDSLERDALVRQLKNEIKVSKVPNAENTYDISYSDTDPTVARDVVYTLLQRFVTDTLGAGQADSSQVEGFLSGQIAIYEKRLQEAEERLASFKKDNLGLMPGEGGDYYTRMAAAQDEVQTLQAQMSVAVRRRDELQRQLEGEEPTFGVSGMGPVGARTSVDQTIATFERQEKDLLLKYTEKHPDVAAVRETLKDLYRVRDSERQAGAALGNESKPLEMNPVYQDIRKSLSRANVEIASLQAQLRDKQGVVGYLRKMLNTIPEVEAELNRLDRDYNVVRIQYEALVQRLESARLGTEAMKDREERIFDIVEQPAVPQIPEAPNRPALAGLVLLVALIGGVGITFVANRADPVYFSPQALRSDIDLPVFGTVSRSSAVSADPRRWLFAGSAAGLIVAFAGIATVGSRGLSPLIKALAG